MKTIFSAAFILSLLHATALPKDDKINGVCTVAPSFELNEAHLIPIANLGANWMAVIPYAFCSEESPEVIFNRGHQWWGEKTEGIRTTIRLAQAQGLKVMMKPHLWVKQQGWAGDFKLLNPDKKDLWMESYSKYLIHFSKVAEAEGVTLLSIGTEVRHFVKEEPEYWRTLIASIRACYTGKLTYSANWDNYENVAFWKDLDYIGIDAYFPTSEAQMPQEDELDLLNQKVADRLALFSKENNRPIIFTEFGFRSMDYCTQGHWKVTSEHINLAAQEAAYRSFLKTYWDEPWFAGGFAWKWHFNHLNAGGPSDTQFTPQNKPAQNILKEWYLNHP